MPHTVISVENLSKSYRLGQIGTGTLSHDINVWWAKVRGKPNPMLRLGETDHDNRDGEEIWALRDISFTVEKGETLGIIGRNGAGKSTLLKILSRVTAPTSGRVKVKGRIASLLEVGTGFHPDLTGRENIYLNGAILGMTRDEIRRKFDEIVNFSEIEKFIDTPVKRYSSGMYVRLAFAVAAHLDPEILVVDEVLAVGDAAFQKKCLGKMGDVAREGRTVLFVSHNMAAINSLCPMALGMHKGKIEWFGSSGDVIKSYLSAASNQETDLLSGRLDRAGNGLIRICEVSVLNSDGAKTKQIISGENIKFEIKYKIPSGLSINQVVCIINLKTLYGQPLFTLSTRLYNKYLPQLKPNGKIICEIPKFPLNDGSYSVDILIKQGQDIHTLLDRVEHALNLDIIAGDYFGTGREAPSQDSPVLVEHNWYVS